MRMCPFSGAFLRYTSQFSMEIDLGLFQPNESRLSTLEISSNSDMDNIVPAKVTREQAKM